ncbi:hypothetical protein [Streptomyces sp. NPDC052496]|uniref:hypothetical protein n=1 Tax=Streptomyces sp. NPDC052496 TaxID=3154951 RepID=UPI00341AA6B2
MPRTRPRLFTLQRDTDVTGVSGTGTVSVRWRGDRPSTVFWDSLTDAVAIHGHGGATRIVWDDRTPEVS